MANLLTVVPIDYEAVKKELYTSKCFNGQIDTLRSKMLLTLTEINQRHEIAQIVETILNGSDKFDGEIRVFGSTANSLGFKNADLDLHFELKRSPPEPNNDYYEDQLEYATNQLSEIREVLLQDAMFDVVTKPRKKVYNVPIIAVKWPRLQNSISCDIAVNAGHAVHHAKLISYFSLLEPLFHDLSLVTLTWMKNSKIINSNRLNSLSAILMVAFYMQVKKLLPSVRSLQATPSTKQVTSYEFNDDLSWKSPIADKPNIGQLFIEFFHFYATFDSNNVISPNYATAWHKSDLMNWNEDFAKPGFVIQDLFDLSVVVTGKMTKAFTDELINTFQHLSIVAMDIAKRKGQDDAPKSMLCYLLDKNVISSRHPRRRQYLSGTQYF